MKKIAVAVAVVLLIAGAFFGGKWYWQGNNDGEVESSNEEAVVKSEHYFAMDRFIISIGNDKATRYLVLDLNLVFDGSEKNIAAASQFTPLFRNALVRQFTNLNHQQAKAIFEDIDKVQSQLLENFNAVLKEKTTLQLNSVLITNVFIQ